MLSPFFALAAQSPTRQAGFRQAVAVHLVLLGLGVLVVAHQGARDGIVTLGHLLLVAGIVEGATLIGWRLTQLPRSQALEFLLVSPLRPRPLFLAEACVGLTLLGLVTLSGLPVLLLLVAAGPLDRLDPIPLLVMPFTWGAVTGLGLTVWAYEPKQVRRRGEKVVVALLLVYLLVGVLAGENLKSWLEFLPTQARISFVNAFTMLHTHNPFGALRHWLQSDFHSSWDRLAGLQLAATALVLFLLARGAARLQGHFHERHYEPVRDVSRERRPAVGDKPLTWWAVKRVSEYSGRINLWLAGGFCLLYALYAVAGAHWPVWMGRRIFQMCDEAGGVPALTAALVVLAAVPAAFQYGLWDSNAQDRCRRLELLLLTNLQPRDYWDAAARAAWVRGRGYFLVAGLLWLAGLLGGRLSLAEVFAGAAAGTLLWSLYFALGFRAFARGAQANRLGMVLTVGLPLAAVGLARLGWPTASAWLPPGMVYSSAGQTTWTWLLGPVAVAALTLGVARWSLRHGDAQLRRWYDQHHGSRVMN